MMKGKNLLIALGILIVLIIVAIIVTRKPPEEKIEAHFPEVKKDEITKVWIKRALTERDKKKKAEQQFEEVTVEKQGEGENAKWFVTKPIYYEAYQSYIDSMLSRLEEMKISEIAAEKRQSWKELEIDDSSAAHVKVYKKNEKIMDFYIGKYKGGATMVRFPNDDRVYRVRGSIRYVFIKPVRDWREKRIINVNNEDVTRIEFESENGKFAFAKVEGEWKNESETEIPDFDSKKVNSYLSTLAHLRAADFEDKLSPAEVGFENPIARATIHYVVKEKEENGQKDKPEVKGKEDLLAQQQEEGNQQEEGSSEETQEKKQKSEEKKVIKRVLLGNKKDESNYYVMLEGKKQIFLITKYTAKRLMPEPKNFSTPPKKEDESKSKKGKTGKENSSKKAETDSKIPPEVMKKIQEEIKKKQMLKKFASGQK